VGNPSGRDEIPLHSHVTLQAFYKWAIDFIGPINSSIRRLGARYIIIAIEYLTRWVEATSVIDCTMETTAWFLFENVFT
jgi:hypothetical protein